MSEASFLIPIPIAEYVTVFRAIPGIVATMLPSHLSRLDNEQSRESIVTAADLALIHQVAGAALLPEEHRKSIIRRALHSLLYHVQPMLKPA